MKMGKYAASSFISLKDVRKGPLREVIAIDAKEGSFERPVLMFESGRRFSLNKTNVTALIRDLGDDSKEWVGVEIELYAGTIKYQDEPTESVRVRLPWAVPDAADKSSSESAKPVEATKKPHDDMDDAIPF